MKTKNTVKSIKATLAIILAAVTALLTFCSCSAGKKKIDIEDYITVEYSSFNRHATAKLTVDYDAIEALVDDEKMSRYFAKVNPQDAEIYSYYGDSSSLWTFIDIGFAQEYKNLANGDVITVTATPSEEMESAGKTLKDIEKGLGISIKDAEIKVEGLEEAKEIDLFTGIEDFYTFTGVNGSGMIKIEVPNDISIKVGDFYLKQKTFSNGLEIIHNNQSLGVYTLQPETDGEALGILTPKDDYKKGDIAKISISYRYDLKTNLENLGYVAKSEEYKITVPDLGSYVTSASQLSKADIEAIKKEFTEEVLNKDSSVQLVSAYFGTINPDQTCEDKKKTAVFIHCTYNVIFSTRYKYYMVDSLVKNDAGEFEFNLNTFGTSTYNRSGVESLPDSYTYEQLF